MPSIHHIPQQSEILGQIIEHRLDGLSLVDGFIHPNYRAYSILNLPSSVCHFLGVPGFGAEPLSSQILFETGENYRRVVLILMDALSYKNLLTWIEDGTSPVWRALIDDGILTPLTSIVPSTTSAVLTSLWTGRSAAVHGIVGYVMWLKEYGLVANTILHTPISFKNDVGGLARTGFEPQKFLNLSTLGSHLAIHGIESYAFQYAGIVNSGLSQMFFADVKRQAFSSSSDLWVNARQLLSDYPGKRMYLNIYWGLLDSIAHRYGPEDERTRAEFSGFSVAFEQLFLASLTSGARQDTLLILTADHGMLHTPLNPNYNLSSHPDLTSCLHMLPTGESRLVYLHVRPGLVETVRGYIEQTWPNQFQVIESKHAMKTGLFGPGRPHLDLINRIGDLIVIGRDSAYLWWSDKEDFMLGRHGGLHPDEMLVPYLAVEL